MIIAWVLGSGGLFGSSLSTSLKRESAQIFNHSERLNWRNETYLTFQLMNAVRSFAEIVSTKSCYWQIYWAAGIGNLHSSKEELALETRVLSKLLIFIQTERKLYDKNGCIIFSSSAGALYAGSKVAFINESTEISPTTEYAHQKLIQEKLVSEIINKNLRWKILIVRIATLYGEGQALGKQQGLISEIARRMLRNQPINIYVPFDTIRDYVYSIDAAAITILAAKKLNNKHGVFIKIIASEIPTTIAQILTTFKQVTKRKIRINIGNNNFGTIYSPRIEFHSINIPIETSLYRTSLLIGISRVIANEHKLFIKNK